MENDTTSNINFEKVIDAFVEQKTRKKNYINCEDFVFTYIQILFNRWLSFDCLLLLYVYQL